MEVGAILRSDLSVADKIRALSVGGLPRAEIARRLGAFMDAEDIVRCSDMTLADKIRALAAGGLPRADVARRLGKRYQHVRNVLEGDKLHPSVGGHPGVSEQSRPYQAGVAAAIEDRGGGAYRLAVGQDGSILLPEAVRRAFGISGGGAVIARLEGDEFKLVSVATGLRRAQERLRPYMIGDESWADSLIADRRSEAAREEGDG